MDRAHRKELKHDKFVEQVGHSVEYAAEHRSQFARYGVIAVGVILAAVAFYFYVSGRAQKRQEELAQAMRIVESQIGPPSEFFASYPTQDEKDKAIVKTLTELTNKYPGSREGLIGRYFLGLQYADKGNLAEAEKQLKQVADSGKDEYASQAKLSLSQIYEAQNRPAEAEKILKSVVDSPTILVSKEQATIALARVKARSNPAEARKMLEPLRTERGPVSRAAITTLSDLPPAAK